MSNWNRPIIHYRFKIFCSFKKLSPNESRVHYYSKQHCIEWLLQKMQKMQQLNPFAVLHYQAHSNDIFVILFFIHIDTHATAYPYFRTTTTLDKKNRRTKFFLPINFKICSFVLLSKYSETHKNKKLSSTLHKKGGTDGRPHPGILQKQLFAKRDSMKRWDLPWRWPPCSWA